MWGSYYLKSLGILDFMRVWIPNPNLKMTEEEQYKENKKNCKDFSKYKYIPPAGRIICE